LRVRTTGSSASSCRNAKRGAFGISGPPKRTTSVPQFAQRPTWTGRPASVVIVVALVMGSVLLQQAQKQPSLPGSASPLVCAGAGIKRPVSGIGGGSVTAFSKAARKAETVNSPGVCATNAKGTVTVGVKVMETRLSSWVAPGG